MLMTAAIVGIVVWVLVVGMALGLGPNADEQQPATPEMAVAPARFFAGENRIPAALVNLPIDLIVSQLEYHIRLEQAAAENFLHAPNLRNLHARTSSSLLGN